MRLAIALFALTAAVIGATWTWLGRPVAMPPGTATAGGKLYCVSYAPFHGTQTPLDPNTRIGAVQLDDDLSRLAKLTDCVRTYSVDYGLDQIAEIAGRHGLKVIQGLWLSSDVKKNSYQIETAVALANKFPGIIQSLVVGNEVLLRGEMSAEDLARTIRAVKARVHVPVTYADVWEYLLRNPDVAAATDFITIHILPYWEDFPIRARNAGAHVDAIRARVASAIPGKEILIGEFGWPSAGRMRDGALPSPANQARVIQDELARSRRGNYRVNMIEAFDQPWKRALEGTVGGHWGVLDDGTGNFKFRFGAPVSNHKYWLWQAVGGIIFAILIFGAAAASRRAETSTRDWIAVALLASVAGVCIGWTIETIPLQSLGAGGWARSLAMGAAAVLAPPIAAAAITSRATIPTFADIIGPIGERTRDPLTLGYGIVLIATAVLAVTVALGLVFDPRYRDFPFAPLTAAIVPFALHRLVAPRVVGAWAVAELAFAAVLLVSALYIAINESLANWQSLWLCAALAALALTLAPARVAQG
jgi:glucan 1,3-beta-glucosidase